MEVWYGGICLESRLITFINYVRFVHGRTVDSIVNPSRNKRAQPASASVVSAEARTPPVQRRGARKVSGLRSEIADLAERLDTSQHKLDSPVRGARCIARKLVAGKLNLVECETTLSTPKAKVAGTSESAAVVFGVVGGVEGSAGILLETLEAVPLRSVSLCDCLYPGDFWTYGHVLESEEGTVGVKEHVQVTRADKGVVGVLDNALEHTVLRRAQTLVTDSLVGGRVAEHTVHTLVPVGGRSVNCLLDVCAVEVDLGARRNIVARVDLTENRVRVRASFGDVVDVEAWVDLQDGSVGTGELVA